MTKYFLLLAVIFSVFGLTGQAQADNSKKDSVVDFSSMQFTVDKNNNGIEDDEEEDPDSKEALGD